MMRFLPRCGRAGTRSRLGTVAVSFALWLAILISMGSPAAGGESWVWPTSGSASGSAAFGSSVERGFAAPAKPWAAGHRGVDLISVEGAAIYAAGAGSVQFAGTVGGRGVVVIGHADGTRTTYEPVRSSLGVGVNVRAGQQLGVLGRAFSHCVPQACLHWGRLRGQTYLDPLALVGRGGPARLLPVWRQAQPEDFPTVVVGQVARPPAGTHDASSSGGGLRLAKAPSGTSALLLWCVAVLLAWLVLSRPRFRAMAGGAPQVGGISDASARRPGSAAAKRP